MNRKRVLLAFPILIIILIACSQNKEKDLNGSFIAFSLREAQNILTYNFQKKDSNVYSIGGITRLAGIVIDRSSNDIIIVGQHITNLPDARFDDLVVALRARFLHNEMPPMVSIDPVEDTNINNRQEVNFGGHIENTSFGNDFLLSDIFLKKYSLELVQKLHGVESYCKLYLDKEINKIESQGISIDEINWVSNDSINNYQGFGMDEEINDQSRFWFNYKEPYRIRIRDDVLTIMSLDIILDTEQMNMNNKNSPEYNNISPNSQFIKLFSDNFYHLSNKYPSLQRLKLLFDMTAIAEGLKNSKNIPNISYLLNKHNVKFVNTRTEFELIKKCAIVKRSDGKTNLFQLSGGIETSIEVELLNAGDVSYLKKIVLESRPFENSLFWKLPIDQWEMPNSEGVIVNKSQNLHDRKKNGCSVSVNSVQINPNNKNNMIFNGFAPIEPAKPFKGGVDMKMVIDSSSFKKGGKELEELRDQIFNNIK